MSLIEPSGPARDARRADKPTTRPSRGISRALHLAFFLQGGWLI